MGVFSIVCMARVGGLNTVLVDLKNQLVSKPLRFQQRMMYHQNPKETNRDEIESIISLFDTEIEREGSKKEALELLKGLYLLRVDSAIDDAHECIQFLSQENPSVCYAHSLVHKLEGTNRGELGLTGYSNCAYWIGQMGTSNFPTYDDLAQYAWAVGINQFASNQVVRSFVNNDLGSSGENHGEWDPNRFLTLCVNSAKAVNEEESEVVAFCEGVVRNEWELLVQHISNQC